MGNEDSDDERAFLLLNKIIAIVKEYAAIDTVLKINVELPKDYPMEKLKAYFLNMDIELSPKISKTGVMRIVDIELKE